MAAIIDDPPYHRNRCGHRRPAFLAEWLATYDRRAPFHCHLAWHLAMFELHRGRYARALEILRRDILGAVNPRLAMIDGSALLWRFWLDGEHGGHEGAWRSLADLAGRVSRPGFRKGHPIAGAVALPLVQGSAAFVAGDHAGALRHLEPVAAETHRIGGSHAQWELFEETMVVCYLALERYDDAIGLVRRRLQRRASPRDLRWLDRAGASSAG